MMMSADYAHAAYEAARRRDLEGVYAALTDVVACGPDMVAKVMRTWMDRTLTVMVAVGSFDPSRPPLLELESEHSGTGDAEPVDSLPPEVVWAGRLFTAYIHRDQQMFSALWKVVPNTPQGIAEHLMVLLTTMTTTAAAHAEAPAPITGPAPTGLDAWMRANPETAAARIALAHLN